MMESCLHKKKNLIFGVDPIVNEGLKPAGYEPD
jgi:hypothetical protein